MSTLLTNTISDVDSANSIDMTKAQPGSRVKTYLFTESTDLTVNSSIPAGINFGSSQTIVIPTKGLIQMILVAEITAVTTTASFALGINDGAANFWGIWNDNATISYMGFGGPTVGTTDGFYGIGSSGQGWFSIPIEEHGVATGSRTIQTLVADNDDTSSHTIDGATGGIFTPAQMYVAVWDFT